MIYGLGAALGWGLSDFMVAIVARRIGSFLTVVLAQAAGLVLFTVLLTLHLTHLPAWHVGLLILPLIGVSGALSYLAFYRGLELGPIALVSPIAAGYAAIVIGLSLVVLREAVPALALVGAGIIVAGIVLAATDPRALREDRSRGRSGIFFAVLAMAGFGVGAFLIGRFAKTLGWFGAVYLSRLGSAAALALFLAVTRRRERAPIGLAAIALAALVGLLDIVGFASFARGSELGFISITAAASVTYPLIPILFGVLYLRERPATTQWVGVGVVLTGLAVLAAGR